jgi:hypothetical protein
MYLRQSVGMDLETAPNRASDAARVFRRKVLYIPGYDPFPPRRYREIYRSEGAVQARLGGYDLTMIAQAKRDAGTPYGWTVEGHVESPAVAEFEVLVWSDLVRASMTAGILGTYRMLLRTGWLYLSSGAMRQLIRLRKGPMVAALYPAVFLILYLLIALSAGGLVAWLAAGLPWGLGWALGAGTVWAILEAFRRADRRVYVYYLMHDYAFTTALDGAYPAKLVDRMDQFRDRIRAALADEVDEVLVVGHSSGVQLGVSVLADLIRGGIPAEGPELSFLSLGHAVPMLSFLPKADKLRGDLAYLSQEARVTWVDVSAPGDGCSFALCDPVGVSGVAPSGQRWPLILSAAFSQTLRPERWLALRRQYFRLHFQYLCAFDNLPGKADDYDYFRITAGSLTLAERFKTRKPSASRTTQAFSPHRTVA